MGSAPLSGEQALLGCRVLVTRPRHQASGLVQHIEAEGGEALCLPTIEIQPLPLNDLGWDMGGDAAPVDGIIFISPNAVENGIEPLRDAGLLNRDVRVAAVGSATANTLRSADIPVDLVPQQGADSEALLAHPDLQRVAGQRYLIVRGEGGRELLATTLRERGAEVRYAEVYCRVIPEQGGERLRSWLAARAVDVLTSTSAAGLRNLLDLAGAKAVPLLRVLPLVVVSERMLQLAVQLGFKGPIQVAEAAGDIAVTEAVIELWT